MISPLLNQTWLAAIICQFSDKNAKPRCSVITRLCPRSRIMAVVKADAYGHGLQLAAAALAAAEGFAVASLQEANLLRTRHHTAHSAPCDAARAIGPGSVLHAEH